MGVGKDEMLACWRCLIDGKSRTNKLCLAKYREKDDVPWSYCQVKSDAIYKLIEDS